MEGKFYEELFIPIKNSYDLLFALQAITSCKPKSTNHDRPILSPKKGKTRIDPFTGLEVMVESEKDLAFRLYQGPKPPKVVTEQLSSFPVPPKGDIETRDYGPLKVLRGHPIGKVKKMGMMTVAFNQPMIPLTSLENQRKIPVPVQISPKPAGKFKWLGTTVIGFEPEKRFPFSTRYVVKIPSGVKSASGKVLENDNQFVFETPRVKIINMKPYSYNYHVIPETALVLQFNQEVEPEHILAQSSLRGAADVPLKLVPYSQWKSVKPMGGSWKTWKRSRTVVLKPIKKLKKATDFTFVLRKGTKSKEGPLHTLKDEKHSFRTYSPLVAKGVGCGWKLGPCNPYNDARIEFNNSIRINDDDLKKYIRVTPKIKGLKLKGYGNNIYLRGN